MRKLVTLSLTLGALHRASGDRSWDDFEHIFGSTAMSKFSHTDMDPSGSTSSSCFVIETDASGYADTGYSKLDVTRWIPATAFGTVGAKLNEIVSDSVLTRQDRWLEGDTDGFGSDSYGHMLENDALTSYYPVVSLVPLQLRNVSILDSTDAELHQLQTYVPHPLANSGEANLVDFHTKPVAHTASITDMRDHPWAVKRLGDIGASASIENLIAEDTVSFRKPRTLSQATCVGADFDDLDAPNSPDAGADCISSVDDSLEYNTISATPIIVDERFGSADSSHDCRPRRYATSAMIRSLQKLSADEVFGREFDPNDANIPCVKRTDSLWTAMDDGSLSDTVPFANKYGEHVCRDFAFPTVRVWAYAGGTDGIFNTLYVKSDDGVTYYVHTSPGGAQATALGSCNSVDKKGTLTIGGLETNTECEVVTPDDDAVDSTLTFTHTTRSHGPSDNLILDFRNSTKRAEIIPPASIDPDSKVSLYVYLKDIGKSSGCDHEKYGDDSTQQFTSGWPLMKKHVEVTTRDNCDYEYSGDDDPNDDAPTNGLCITYESEAPLVAWTSYGIARSLAVVESTWGFPGDGAVSPGQVDYSNGLRWNVYRKDSDTDRQVESEFTRDIAFAVYEDWVAADTSDYATSPDTKRVRQSIQTHDFQLSTTVFPDEITELETSFEVRASLFDASLRTIRPVFKYVSAALDPKLAFIEFELQLDIDTSLMPPSSLDVAAVRLISSHTPTPCVIESEDIQQYPIYSSDFEYQPMSLTISSDPANDDVQYDAGSSSTTLRFALLPGLGSDTCASLYTFTANNNNLDEGDVTLNDMGDFSLEVLFDVVSYVQGDGTTVQEYTFDETQTTLSWTDFNTNSGNEYDVQGSDGRFTDSAKNSVTSYVESAFSIMIDGVPFDAVLPDPHSDTQEFTWNTIDYQSRVTGLKYGYTNMQKFEEYQSSTGGPGGTEGAGYIIENLDGGVSHDPSVNQEDVLDLSVLDSSDVFDPHTGFAHNWGSQFSVASCAGNDDIFDLDLVHVANGDAEDAQTDGQNHHFANRVYHTIDSSATSSPSSPSVCDLVTYGLTDPVVGPSASYMDFELTYDAREGELHNANVHQLATWICAKTKADSALYTVSQEQSFYGGDFPCADDEVAILLQRGDIEYMRRATREATLADPTATETPEMKYLTSFFTDAELDGTDYDTGSTGYGKLGVSTLDLRGYTQYDYSHQDDSFGIDRDTGDRDVYPEICDRGNDGLAPDGSVVPSETILEDGECKRTNSTFDRFQYVRYSEGKYRKQRTRDAPTVDYNPPSDSEYGLDGSGNLQGYSVTGTLAPQKYSDPHAYADPTTGRADYPAQSCLARMNLMHMRSVASGDYAELDPAVCMSMDTYINGDGDKATVKGRVHVSDARFSRAFDSLTIKTRLILDLDEYAADDGAAFGNEGRRRLLQTVEEVTTQVSLSAQYVADADLGNCASTSTDGTIGTDGDALTEPCGSGCGDGLEISEVSGSTIVCAMATSVTSVSDDKKTRDRFNELEMMLFIILGCVLLLLMMVMFIDVDLNRGEIRFCGRIRALPQWMCRPCRETKEQKLERLRKSAAKHGMKLVAGPKGRVGMWG